MKYTDEQLKALINKLRVFSKSYSRNEKPNQGKFLDETADALEAVITEVDRLRKLVKSQSLTLGHLTGIKTPEV